MDSIFEASIPSHDNGRSPDKRQGQLNDYCLPTHANDPSYCATAIIGTSVKWLASILDRVEPERFLGFSMHKDDFDLEIGRRERMNRDGRCRTRSGGSLRLLACHDQSTHQHADVSETEPTLGSARRHRR
jgi:hypothetical protein